MNILTKSKNDTKLQKQLSKKKQAIANLGNALARLNFRQTIHADNLRKARTRTLIQLGGLVEKSGLADLFDIKLGSDLQLDKEELLKAATLLGFLIEQYNEHCSPNSTQLRAWRQVGASSLAKDKKR